MAAPWNYASSVYLDLKGKLDDGTLVTLKIDRYLNAALKLQRNKDAEKAKDSLLNHIAGELKVALSDPSEARLVDKPTDNPQAYALFIEAQTLVSRRAELFPAGRAVECSPNQARSG